MSYLDKFQTEAVVAALGFNDGANKGFWRIQPRDRIKRWIEMGAEIRAAIKANGKVVNAHGRSVGSTGNPDEVRVLFEGLGHLGIPDGIYSVPSRYVEKVTAVLPEEYVKDKGGKLATNVKPLSTDGGVPEIADLERADVTPDDIRIANEGINSPEGQEQELFKDSPEGKAIAELPVGEAKPASKKQIADVIDTPSDANYAPEKYVTHAINKAGNNEPVNLDDLIMAMKNAPRPVSSMKGQKLNTKPSFMEPGDIFENYGTEYEFESVVPNSRDRVSKTEMVVAKDRNTGEVREIILDTDVATPVFRPDANQPEPEPTPEPTPEPEATPEVPEVPEVPETPEETPAPEDETPAPEEETPIEEIPDVVDEAPEEPTFIPRNRQDNGQDIALPEIDENVLWAKKLAPLRDENGKKVRAIDPATGEYKSTFAEDPDAVLNGILETYPDAVIREDGAIIVERRTFTDPDGTVRGFESIIRRTTGANYMVGYKITEPDGSSKEYYSRDYRDSFSSIHGKTNGIMRMSAVLTGDLPDDYLPTARKKNSKEWQYYFASGKFEDRLKYFRGKFGKSKLTRQTLLNNLAKANATGKLDEIGLAEYNLDLLDREFDGDIERYRENAKIQEYTLITLEETADKYLTGRYYVLNNASGKSNGTVLRSAVNGIYGAIEAGDVQAVTEGLKEMAGRLPDLVRSPEIAQLILERFRAGVAKRFPGGNRSTLSALVTNGFKAWTKEGYDEGAVDAAPHVAWNGNIIGPNMLVEYTNNDNQKSIGVVHRVEPKGKSSDPDSPNEYFDYVWISFKGQDGKMQPPVRLAAKNTKVLDNSGLTEEALSKVTAYNENIGGDEMRRKRFGDTYIALQQSRYNDMFPGANDTIATGYSPRIVDPAQYQVDDLVPGGYLYDSEGLPVGQIAAVRDTTSESGEKGYTFAHVAPNGEIGFTSVKAGQTRAPKADISKEDGRGSSASDEGFTANPADFRDAGLDAEGIGSESADADQKLMDLIEGSSFYNTHEAILGLAALSKLKSAQYQYENAESDEDKTAAKEGYKKALESYYTRLAKHKALSAKTDGEAYDPDPISSDPILEAAEITAINAKIKATHKPFEASGKTYNKTRATYDDLVAAHSGPENTYSGYLPEGWSAMNPEEALSQDTQARKSIFNSMLESFMDGKGEVSDALVEAITKRAQVESYTNNSGKIDSPDFHILTGAAGDKVQAYKDPSGEGYAATDADLDATASVIESLRSKLDLGDAPLTGVLINSDAAGLGSSGTLGFVYSRNMWDREENFANFHSVVDKVNKFIAEFGVSPREEFVQGKSWMAVDIGQDPEMARRYVAAHELGHVMQGKVLRNLGISPSQKEWDKLYGPIADTYRISQYGTTNYNEHFAESFARWELTGVAEPKFLKFLADAKLLKDK